MHFKLKSNFKALFLATARLLTPQMRRRPQFRKSTSAVTKCCSCGTSHTTLTLLCKIFKDVHQRCSNVFFSWYFSEYLSAKKFCMTSEKRSKVFGVENYCTFLYELGIITRSRFKGQSAKITQELLELDI